jgi:dihydroneopterin aldolase
MMQDYQKASINDIDIKVGIGIHAWEYKKKQRILVDVDLYRFNGAFKGKKLSDCIDYDQPFNYVTQVWPQREHTDLVEMLAEELVEFCLRIKTVEAVRVRIRKPDVYKGKAVPGIEFFRTNSAKKKRA